MALAAVACGDDSGGEGSCTVEQLDGGAAEISCDDGTSAVVPGGGGDCTVEEESDGTKTISCSDGTSVTVTDGEKGDKGDPGPPGRDAYTAGPGLKVEIESVSIPDDRYPVVTLHMSDANDVPLDRAGKHTPGSVSVGFVFSKLNSTDGKVGHYAPYNVGTFEGMEVDGEPAGAPETPVLEDAKLPRSESNGTWTELDPAKGQYSYRMSNPVSEDYDNDENKTKTHTLAVYSSRTVEGVQYASNPIFDMRPDGEDVSEQRAIITTDGCNKCHGTLMAHGGSRRETKLCITCHVDGMNDPESGNSIDMAQMIHKIHSGASLPSVVGMPSATPPVPGTPYVIYGYMNTAYDFSHVVFPQEKQNCVTCHTGAAGDRWKTELSQKACGSCHDRTSFKPAPAPPGFTLHNGGQQTTDDLCATCHGVGKGPVATKETDVVKVHKRLEEMPLRNSDGTYTEPPKLTGEVLEVTSTGPAETPVVRFEVKVDGDSYDILTTPLDRLRFTLAGPTTDYLGYAQYKAFDNGVAVAGTGTLALVPDTTYEFTWTAPLTMQGIANSFFSPALVPEIPAAGSFAVGLEGRIKGMATPPDGVNVSVSYPMHNPVFYFKVTDTEVVPRREAVVVENCNNCHQDLGAHGGSRNDPEYCVLCHTANKDSTQVPFPPAGETKLTASVRFSHMIHRVHTGENGANEYNVAGHDYSKLLFPADRRDCTMCHVPDHYELPLPELLPSYTTLIDSTGARVDGTDPDSLPDPIYTPATAAACTGCHDSDDAVAHTEVMTTAMGTESCTTCHGTGSEYDIDVVHATPGL